VDVNEALIYTSTRFQIAFDFQLGCPKCDVTYDEAFPAKIRRRHEKRHDPKPDVEL